MILISARAARCAPSSFEALTYVMQCRFLLGQLLAQLNRLCPQARAQPFPASDDVNIALFIKAYTGVAPNTFRHRDKQEV